MLKINKYVYLMLCVFISLLFVSYVSNQMEPKSYIEAMKNKNQKELLVLLDNPIQRSIKKGRWNDYQSLGIHHSCLYNGKLSIDHLLSVLYSGIRCLHFHVASMNEETVVTKMNNTVSAFKRDECIKIRQIFKTIENHAFRLEIQNYNEPLVVFMEIYSCRPKVFNDIARRISKLSGDRLLDKKYSYNSRQNMDMNYVEYAPIEDLQNNIIFVFRERYDPFCKESTIRNTELYEYANIIIDDIDLVQKNTRTIVPTSVITSKSDSGFNRYKTNNRQAYAVAYVDKVSKSNMKRVMNSAIHTLYVPMDQIGSESVKEVLNSTFYLNKDAYTAFSERPDSLKPVILDIKGKAHPDAVPMKKLLNNITAFDAIGFKPSGGLPL